MASALIIMASAVVSCASKPLDLDIGLFSRDAQTFYFHNAATAKDYQLESEDPAADKLVCIPNKQYLQYLKDYTCTKNK